MACRIENSFYICTPKGEKVLEDIAETLDKNGIKIFRNKFGK